jgi:hypothetical protein
MPKSQKRQPRSTKRTAKVARSSHAAESTRAAGPPAEGAPNPPERRSAPRDPNALVNRVKKGQTPEAAHAELMVEGIAMNAVVSIDFSKKLGQIDLTECMAALVKHGRQASEGDLTALEALLAAQATTLNAMFTQLAGLAAKQTLVDPMDRLARLALKAQGQCRTTIETLALIKGGIRTVFARQANFAAGPQQVNNGETGETDGAFTRAEIVKSEPNKLLEAHGERVDLGAAAEAIAGDSALAAVGTLDGASRR